MRWEVTLPLPGLPLRGHRELVEALPDLGWSGVWTGEGGGLDGLTPLAAAAAWQPRLRVGTGVLPVQTRGPAVLAQTAAALAGLTDAGVLLGVGSSVPAHVTALNGIGFDRPYARVRDTVRFLRAAVRGQLVDEDYATFAVRGFRLPAPARPPKIVVGALRPRMVRLGLDEGDGVITNILSAADLGAVLAAAGPVPGGKEIVVKVFVCPTEDARFARATGRRFLGWITNQPPYRAFHDWLGRGAQLAASRAAFDAGDIQRAGAAIPDDVVDALWVHGSPDECRARLAAFAQAGVSTVLVYLAPTPEPLPLAATLSALRPTDSQSRH
ncbi:probable F420-dependent oxidoreductase, Rv3093c family [Pseudonocardia thermophila]|uniref:Probable F420-dependent oxidoreductase, Rv3093c family n=1 Tax=Pseudonocardia thermophila TaxID=1848 RepID=A0A1M6TH91_PSETH|nr:LLM class F420-dependent oxidoreductase [Pseudonocardia thermophila]SHK56365.1 probable F420-dependent oxidoreductase, Rv3093c family [Pseudonocardia thermophila]